MYYLLETQKGPVEVYTEDWEPDMQPGKQAAFIVYRSDEKSGVLCPNKIRAQQIKRAWYDGHILVLPVAITPELKLEVLSAGSVSVQWSN